MLAFLEMREERWTHGFVEAEARTRGSDPEERLLAIFDVFDEWFHREDFEACSFINVLLEMGPQHPAGDASVEYLDHIRSIVRRLRRRSGPARHGVVRPLVAHPHEGLDRLGGRG